MQEFWDEIKSIASLRTHPANPIEIDPAIEENSQLAEKYGHVR